MFQAFIFVKNLSEFVERLRISQNLIRKEKLLNNLAAERNCQHGSTSTRFDDAVSCNRSRRVNIRLPRMLLLVFVSIVDLWFIEARNARKYYDSQLRAAIVLHSA